jgi:hypothetical protein
VDAVQRLPPEKLNIGLGRRDGLRGAAEIELRVATISARLDARHNG